MGKEQQFYRLFQYLQDAGIRVTHEFVKDIESLVQSNTEKFAKQIYADFSRKEFEKYNRFEKLTLSSEEKNKIKGNDLWRYEYRYTSNLRCIFIIKSDNNIDIPIIICAFNENGHRKKGKESYKDNIKRAINIIERRELL